MDFILTVAACVLIAVVGFATVVTAYVAAEAWYYQSHLGRHLKQDLGFSDGAAYVAVGGRTHSAVAVGSVTPGGAFEAAGVRAGDVFPGVSHTDLFRHLHRHRGRVAELAVVTGGPGPPFQERPRRVVHVNVPPTGSAGGCTRSPSKQE